MCLPYGALFCEIWYSDQGGVHLSQRSPNYIKWVYLGQIALKTTQLVKIWCFSIENGILMGGKLGKILMSRESQIFNYLGTRVSLSGPQSNNIIMIQVGSYSLVFS